MTERAAAIVEELRGMPAADRRAVADTLYTDLEEAGENGDDALDPEWAAEINRRVAAFDAGEIGDLSWEEVRARLRANRGC